MMAGAMSSRGDHPDEAVDGIYASIVDASSIHDLHRSLSETLGAPISAMMRIDDNVTPVSSLGFDPTAMQSYHDHYHRTDPWIAAGMTLPLGMGVNVERLVPRDMYLESEFYRDFMRDHGDATQLMGVMFATGNSRYSLTFMRVGGQADFEEAQERRFARWSPHLRRAFATRERLDRQRRGVDDPVAMGADADVVHVLVTSDLSVCWMSREDLDATPGVVVRHRPAGRPRLEALSSSTQHMLLRTVAEATGRGPRLSGAVRLGEDFILIDPYPWNVGRDALALIHLPDRRAVEARAVERATGLFGLTAAEAGLCRRLMRGDTIERHADALGLSAWTVRTHLRNVFGKTGTGRQAELVALLHRLAR